jgi:outer membrane protein TolC
MRGQPWKLALGVVLLVFSAAAASAQELDPDLTVPPVPPAPGRALTLQQALAIADADAPDLEILRLQIERSEAAERVAWAGVLPVISGSLTYQRFDEEIVRAGVGTVRNADQFTGQIGVVETLSLRTLSAVRMAEAVSDMSRLSLEDARRMAHGSIANVYFAVLAARHAAELTRTQLADAVRQYDAIRTRHELGAAIGLDVSRAEVAALDSVRRSADADAALERARDQLGAALGLDEPIDAAEVDLAQTPSEADAISRAASLRTDVRAAQANRELAGRALDDAWFRFAPSLSLSWVGTMTFPTTFLNPDPFQWIATISLNVPFYDGGVRYGALRDAEAALAQADERVEAVERQVRIEVRDALRSVATAERNLRIAARQAEVARRAAQAAEASYAEGRASGIELDLARRDAERAELSRILAELELSRARVDLLTSTGDL